jgi:uncharacterized protein (TIGR02145 family)
MNKNKRFLISISTILFIFITNVVTAQKEVIIGTQTWTASNLNVSKFKNGDIITEAKSLEEWRFCNEKKTPAWCYYENDSTNAGKYGKLYNYYAVIDARGIAPIGWRVPNDKEWDILVNFLGGSWNLSGNKLKTQTGWKVNNGNNSTGFGAPPGGRRGLDGVFIYMGIFAFYWSTTTDNNGSAGYRNLVDFSDRVFSDYTGKGNGFSVRCIKN